MYQRSLEIVGIGYSVEKQGEKIRFQLGRSYPDLFPIPGDVAIETKGTRVAVQGENKARVHCVAAQIRSLRPPEPYKGKGIRYEGEVIRLKKRKK